MYIYEEGQKIDTLLDIADKFNNHFSRVGEALTEKIKPSNLNNLFIFIYFHFYSQST